MNDITQFAELTNYHQWILNICSEVYKKKLLEEIVEKLKDMQAQKFTNFISQITELLAQNGAINNDAKNAVFAEYKEQLSVAKHSSLAANYATQLSTARTDNYLTRLRGDDAAPNTTTDPGYIEKIQTTYDSLLHRLQDLRPRDKLNGNALKEFYLEEFKGAINEVEMRTKGYGLLRVKAPLSIEELGWETDGSSYILTDTSFSYYNKSENSLTSINIDEDKLAALHQTFASANIGGIIRLSEPTLQEITSITGFALVGDVPKICSGSLHEAKNERSKFYHAPIEAAFGFSLKKIDELINRISEVKTDCAHHFNVDRVTVTWEDFLKPCMATQENINQQDSNGNTLLHHLIANGYHLLVNAAIKLGADLFAKNHQGIMPIDCWTSKDSDHKQTRVVIEAHLVKLGLMQQKHVGVLHQLARCGGYFVLPEIATPLNSGSQQQEDRLVVWLKELILKYNNKTPANDIITYLRNKNAHYEHTAAMVDYFCKNNSEGTDSPTDPQLSRLPNQSKRFFEESLSYLNKMADFYKKLQQKSPESTVLLLAEKQVKFFSSLLKLSILSNDRGESLIGWASLVNYWGLYLLLESQEKLQKECAPLVLLYERKGFWNKLWNGEGLQQRSLAFLKSLEREGPSLAQMFRQQNDTADREQLALQSDLNSAKERLSKPEPSMQKLRNSLTIAENNIQALEAQKALCEENLIKIDAKLAETEEELRKANAERDAVKVELTTANTTFQQKEDELSKNTTPLQALSDKIINQAQIIEERDDIIELQAQRISNLQDALKALRPVNVSVQENARNTTTLTFFAEFPENAPSGVSVTQALQEPRNVENQPQ